jgi:hypothetical protein
VSIDSLPHRPIAVSVRWRARLSLLAASVLLLSTGCAVLGPLVPGASSSAPTVVDPNVPFVVVTVGGVPAATATESVAPTIPDSTPLPRIDPPTRDASSPPRPVASPSLNRGGSAAAQSARPPSAVLPTSPASAAPPAGSPIPPVVSGP